ncbi:MAG: cache domain-containing protein, partial [Rhodocyclaceae bacterium]|nr:cache domain-containing protein [Rhodocyclaceae bacterium]
MLDERPRQLPAALGNRLLASVWTVSAVALAFAGATLAWGSYADYQETIEQEYRFLEAHARIADGQLAGLLRDVRQLLRQIADERPRLTAQQLREYPATLAARNREIPEIQTLAIVDASGRVEMAANPALVGFDGSQRDYYTAHRGTPQNPDLHVSRPYKSTYGDYSVGFSLAMRDERQRLLGAVIAGIHYSYFESVMKDIQPAQPRSVAAIVNRDGDILFRLPQPEKYVGANVAGGAQFQAYLRSGARQSRSIGISQTDGIERIYVYRAIGNTPLSVIMSRPLDDVLAAWRRQLALRAGMFLLAAVVTLRLAWIAHRRQKEVLASREFSYQLMETANAMMVGVDAAGRVIVVNKAAEHICGYRRDELLARDWFETVMPRQRYPEAWAGFCRMPEAGGDVAR